MNVFRRHLESFVRVEPVRPALGAGLRAALAVGLPMVVAATQHLPAVTWVGMAGLFVTLVDRGGPYRDRAVNMGAMTLLGAVMGLVSALQLPDWADVLLTLAWVTACGFARSYGDTPGLMGVVLANYTVVSLALPAQGFADALSRSGLFILGGLWAMMLALVLWPLRPYRPARLAISRCYRALASRAEEVGRWPLEGPPPPANLVEVVDWESRVRMSLEDARSVLASTRRNRAGESNRGEHLLVLLEGADALLAMLVALPETLELAPREPRFHALRAEIQRALADHSRDLLHIARALEQEKREVESSVWSTDRVRRALASLVTEGRLPDSARAAYSHAEALLVRLREYSEALLEVANHLEDGGPVESDLPMGPHPASARSRPLLEPLRDNWGTDSVIFRHAIRLGITAALATALVRGLGLNHGYWVIITVIVVLQPYSGMTFERGVQRAAGTLLGGALAAGLVALVRDPVVLLGAIMAFFAVAIAVKPMSLAAFQVLLAPALVLLAEIQTGDWELAGVRVINTLLGGVLALVGAWLLWPSPEHSRFPEEVANALRADRDYLLSVASARSDAEPQVREARRKLGLQLLSAEASFQRLLSEWRGSSHQLEPAMALLAYARRFGSAVTALAASRQGRKDLAPVIGYAGNVLEDLALAVEHRRAPSPLPRSTAQEGLDVLSRTQMDRLVRQLTVLHKATVRAAPQLTG
ncbi:FUSC family protein [Myxococcus sp. MISCRS1]|uniref:FUSC family protein n=1 Tax=Myxococcus sp. MISCRS1 TaxID=2996786 RepID=UPI00226F4CA7|nr:FUSC family protein [Myxococcus sp. MISCRS1]MCY0998043.1 FUSC family protein [Myxococcus sp. MISCRS1]